LKLFGFSDADWGGCADEQKSTRTYIFTINNTPITWCTKKQTCIALSFTKLLKKQYPNQTSLSRAQNFENMTDRSLL